MTQPTGENEDVLARIRNPVVDAWNDAPTNAQDGRTVTSSGASSSAGAFPPLPFGGAPANRAATAAPPANPATAANAVVATVENVLWLLEPTLWVIGLYLLLSGMESAIDRASPGSLSSPTWRFGTVGAASPALVSVVLGAASFTIALVTRGRRRLSLVMMSLFVLAALALLVLLPLFAMDGIQVRPTLPSRLTGTAMFVSVGLALSNIVLAIVSFIVFALTLRKSARSVVAQELRVFKEWDK